MNESLGEVKKWLGNVIRKRIFSQLFRDLQSLRRTRKVNYVVLSWNKLTLKIILHISTCFQLSDQNECDILFMLWIDYNLEFVDFRARQGTRQRSAGKIEKDVQNVRKLNNTLYNKRKMLFLS